MAHSAWPVRFGYARWLRHLETGEAPSFADIGREVERTGQAVSSWAKAEAPPTDWRVHAPMAAYLGVSKEWLIEGSGDAPRSDLWAAWLAARRRKIPVMQNPPAPGMGGAGRKKRGNGPG